MADSFEKLKKVIISELGVSEDSIVPEASFRDDLGANSQKIFDLILALEDEFGFEIPDEDALLITTIADATTYLDKRLG
ncbi:acyl carrier protein [bacterium]